MFSSIKPKVILDALCGMDLEVVRFESTKSSDKNLAMDSTSDVETDAIPNLLWIPALLSSCFLVSLAHCLPLVV